MLQALEVVLQEQRPDVVLVYGDTNSTLAGALAAAKLQIPLAHVEAGLRSFNRRMPEEINRIVCDRLSQLLFAPTEIASKHLKHEGVSPQTIHVVGDVMYDATLAFAEMADKRNSVLKQLELSKGEYVLSTVHRAENTDDPQQLQAIFSALNLAALDVRIVIPLHPRTRAALEKKGLLERATEKLTVIDPVGYLDMIQLIRNARAVVTDSGGLQKEAFFFGVPCVTLRDETEWTETVEIGANTLVGANADRIRDAISSCLKRSEPLPDAGPHYGNGNASRRIAEMLVSTELSV